MTRKIENTDQHYLLLDEPDVAAAHLLTGEAARISLLAPRYRQAVVLGQDFSGLDLWSLDDERISTITEKQATQLAHRIADVMVKAVKRDCPWSSTVRTDDRAVYFSMYVKPVVGGRWLSLDSVSCASVSGDIVRGAGMFCRIMKEFRQLAAKHKLPVTIVTVENIHTAAMLNAARSAGFRLLHNEHHSTWADLVL